MAMHRRGDRPRCSKEMTLISTDKEKSSNGQLKVPKGKKKKDF